MLSSVRVLPFGSLDGWGWRELKVLPASWYDELARILSKVEDVGIWPDGLFDAHIAMIPKADGDSTPLGQRPLCVLPIVCGKKMKKKTKKQEK